MHYCCDLYRQWSTTYYNENKKLSNTNLAKIREEIWCSAMVFKSDHANVDTNML